MTAAMAVLAADIQRRYLAGLITLDEYRARLDKLAWVLTGGME